MLKSVIAEKGFKKLILILLGLFFLSSLISALVLYKNLQTPISPHYGAAHMILTQVRESLAVKTITINLIFFILIAIGIILLCILYSHRIAGPLFKVKQYAATLGEGRFEERIRFRKKDAVHDLADVLNETAKACQDKKERFRADLKELEEGLKALSAVSDKPGEQAKVINNLLAIDAKIREEI